MFSISDNIQTQLLLKRLDMYKQGPTVLPADPKVLNEAISNNLAIVYIDLESDTIMETSAESDTYAQDKIEIEQVWKKDVGFKPDANDLNQSMIELTKRVYFLDQNTYAAWNSEFCTPYFKSITKNELNEQKNKVLEEKQTQSKIWAEEDRKRKEQREAQRAIQALSKEEDSTCLIL